MAYPDCHYDLDMSDQLAALPKHAGYTTLPPRTQVQYVTFHYSAVNYQDRSHDTELKRIVGETTYQLNHDYDPDRDEVAYPDGLLYDLVVLSDGTKVRTRRTAVQLWHCGNRIGNARSFAVHVMLGPDQDATNEQWSSVVRVFEELRAAHSLPVTHIVGHNEWPRTTGLPQISPVYRLQPKQSACPGRTLHARLADYRAMHVAPPIPPVSPIAAYTADSPLIGAAHATPGQATAYILARDHTNYTEADIANVFVPRYYEVCRDGGIDPVLAIAQMIHETGNLTSFWSARGPEHQSPRRNPAGIGVTGDTRRHKPVNPVDWAYNPHRRLWEAGCNFATWKDHAIPAHIGRLLAYALPIGEGTDTQQGLIWFALGVRPLPPACRGSAPALRALGAGPNPVEDCGWASPGTNYGDKLSEIANAICGMPL